MPKNSGTRTSIVDRVPIGLRAFPGSACIRDRRVRSGLEVDWSRQPVRAGSHKGPTQITEET